MPGDNDVELYCECGRLIVACSFYMEHTTVPVKVGTYKHFKAGATYKVIGIGFNSETQLPEIEYLSATGKRWHRPFHGVNAEGKLCGFFDPDQDSGKTRFEFVE